MLRGSRKALPSPFAHECMPPAQHACILQATASTAGCRLLCRRVCWPLPKPQPTPHRGPLAAELNMTRGSPQQQFAIADLAAVDRTRTPWVVVSWHRLMYSGAADTDSGGSTLAVPQAQRPCTQPDQPGCLYPKLESVCRCWVADRTLKLTPAAAPGSDPASAHPRCPRRLHLGRHLHVPAGLG